MKHAAALALLVLGLAGCASSPALHADKPPKDKTKVAASEVVGESQCYGDGQSGNRVQAVYLVASDRTDRYDTVAGQIRTWANGMDAAVNDSAAQQGGSAGIRWACTGGAVDVAKVTAGPTGDDSLSAVRASLQAAGHGRTDRKYLIWNDATSDANGNNCGVSFVYYSADAAPTYGKTNAGCWGFANSVELHELTHGFGAVNPAAPNANGAWHCTDEYDRMCYNDGSGATLRYVCGSAQERLLDCNHDDYFDLREGSGVAVNMAASSFLEVVPGTVDPSPTPTTTAPTPTATTTSSPTPTVTKSCGKSNRPGCRG
jgi:hypothetical protein